MLGSGPKPKRRENRRLDDSRPHEELDPRPRETLVALRTRPTRAARRKTIPAAQQNPAQQNAAQQTVEVACLALGPCPHLVRPELSILDGQQQETQVEKPKEAYMPSTGPLQFSGHPPLRIARGVRSWIPDHGSTASACQAELELPPSYPSTGPCQASSRRFHAADPVPRDLLSRASTATARQERSPRRTSTEQEPPEEAPMEGEPNPAGELPTGSSTSLYTAPARNSSGIRRTPRCRRKKR
jgi:hypothetical protein